MRKKETKNEKYANIKIINAINYLNNYKAVQEYNKTRKNEKKTFIIENI